MLTWAGDNLVDKKKILEVLLQQLEDTRRDLMSSALEAKDAATNEESKAENKYDTRGLEASYLAGAQAKRGSELTQVILQLSKLELRTFTSSDSVQISAAVTMEVDGEGVKHFFILPFAGGNKVSVDGPEILIITPQSPLGRNMLGKKIGDVFELRTQAKITEYEVIEIF